MSYRFVDSFQAGPEELSETCGVSCQNKFVKLVHLVGFITKKFVTMHGHTNVKKIQYLIFAKFSKDLLATIML